ncbi:hypothetical protein [Pseudomonas putida]|uniref:hypothetical protein n=1 Tax=Pseudomonas putida TaxID=303 RepID=UPI00066D3E08|nr:hypothetical protein [Pseudomonas putida]
MINIPEGTQYIEAGCGNKGFRKYEKGQWWFFEGFWRVVDWKMGDLTPVSSHPSYAAPIESWDGEGLPPVGTLVEASFACEDFENWHDGVCVAVGEDPEGREDFCVVQCGKKIAMYRDEAKRVRPRRTPEQIAADERLHKIRNAHSRIARTLDQFKQDIPGQSAARAVIEAMIDAGYEKQEAS